MRNSLRRRVRAHYIDNEIVRKENYCELLDSYVRSEAENSPDNAIFQLDSAPLHTSLAARSLLAHIFVQNWIGKYGSTNWPAKSPDLTPPKFFLWIYIKDQVFKTPVQNITRLRRRITRAIRILTQEMITKVWTNLENRLDTII